MLVTGAFIATTHPISCGTFTSSLNSCHLVLLLLAEHLSELCFKKVIYKKICKKVHALIIMYLFFSHCIVDINNFVTIKVFFVIHDQSTIKELDNDSLTTFYY